MAELCGVCGQEFGGPADLLEHMREGHGIDETATADAPVATVPRAAGGTRREDPFVCGICGAGFATRERLARHNLFVDHLAILRGRKDRDVGRPEPSGQVPAA